MPITDINNGDYIDDPSADSVYENFNQVKQVFTEYTPNGGFDGTSQDLSNQISASANGVLQFATLADAVAYYNANTPDDYTRFDVRDDDSNNGEYIFISTEVDNYRFERLFNPTVIYANVMDYGAKGDGVTDDSAAIQAALNTGRTVYFPLPDAYYRIGSTLIPQNSQKLIGEHKWANWYLAADQARCLKGDSGVVVISSLLPQYSYPDNIPASADFRRGITLQDLHIQSENAECLIWHYASNFTFRDCAFRANNSTAVSIRYSYRGVIENCFYGSSNHEGYAMTIYDNCNSISIKGSNYATSGSIGGVIDISKSQTIQIEGGVYEINGLDCIRVAGLTAAEADHSEEVGNCSGIVIQGNYFERCYEPISVGKAAAAFGVQITGNFFSNYGSDPVRSCISLGGVHGATIEGNSFIKQDNTQPTLRFYQLVGSLLRIASKINFKSNHVQLSTSASDSGLDYAFDSSYPIGLSGYTFGSSRFEFTQSADIASGGSIEFKNAGRFHTLEQKITANESFLFKYDETVTGGLIEKIEVIGVSGTVDSTLRMGNSANSAANVNQALSGLSLTSGYAVITPSSYLLTANQNLVIQNVAGSGTGTCTIRVTYRK